MIIPVGKEQVYFNEKLVRDLQERILINDFKDARTLNGTTVRQWLDAFCSYMAKECKKDKRKKEWLSFEKCLYDSIVKKDHKEEPVPEQFDFETWWEKIIHLTTESSSSLFCNLKPLYEKMKEWGFDWIRINWQSNYITIYSERILHKEHFHFSDINDFPRTLKESFNWMYNNRVNKDSRLCRFCNEPLEGIKPEDIYDCMGELPVIAHRENEDRWAHKECYKAWRKHYPKQKCDKDGPCDQYKREIDQLGCAVDEASRLRSPHYDAYRAEYQMLKRFPRCPYCGERK